MERQRVLVIGGGVAGMTSALDLAGRGIEVHLVEKSGQIGGQAASYCCKATDKCQKCAACLTLQAKTEVSETPLIKVRTSCQVTGVRGSAGNFTVTLTGADGTEETVVVQAIIVATGFKPYQAERKSEFGYGVHRNVITGYDLEKALQEKGSIKAAFGDVQKIGFVQCVGSRDLQADGHPYCSRVCCMYSSRLAKLIRAELPEAELNIFYMDYQSFGKGFRVFKEELLNSDKVGLIRGIPSKVYSLPYDRLTVRYSDSLAGSTAEEKYDLLVLAAAITPGSDSSRLAEILGIEQDEYGFLAARSGPETVETAVAGVYLAGTCQGPKDIPQTIGHARAAAGAVLAFLQTH